MAGRNLQTDGFVLLKRPPTDSFQTFTVFSAEHGALLVLQRVAKPSSAATATRKTQGGQVPLDLFDHVSLLLESSNQGQTWFVKDPQVIKRHARIGRNYESLRLASALAALIARNPVHEESRAQVARLLETALAAFETADRPDIVYFKSVYCFARDEGYPLKQEWVPALSAPDRASVITLLNKPLASQTSSPADVTRLQRRLDDYLRSHTEILLD